MIAAAGSSSPGDSNAEPAGARQSASVELLEHALLMAGVPQRFQHASFDNFAPRRGTETAIAAARQAFDRGTGLVVTGAPGTGKTHLLVAGLRQRAIRRAFQDPSFRGFASRFVVVPALMQQLRRRMNDPDVPDPMPSVLDAPLLVLDDLGAEKASEWTAETLYLAIATRYNDMRPTLASSNFTLDQLVARGYERVVSRLLEGSRHVHLRVPDWRATH